MEPTKTTAEIITNVEALARTYADTQLWGVIAFFSVLVVVQFATMVYLLLKKDKAYTELINANAEVDKAVANTFEQRHVEFVSVLQESIAAANSNVTALNKLSAKLAATDKSIDISNLTVIGYLEAIESSVSAIKEASDA